MAALSFSQMGFGGTVTQASASPATDGYNGTLNGLPYNIHPTATPAAYTALIAAIAAKQVSVNAYVAPSPPALTVQAASALSVARDYVNNNYIFLAETPPAEWVAYQKALIAIVNGTDTTSTVLPAQPTGENTANKTVTT